MSYFRADYEAMRQIASRLASVSSVLEDESRGNGPVEDFGLPEAVDAVRGFLSGWSHGRSEIVGGIRFASQGLSGAGSFYEKTDGAIAEKM